MTKQEIIERTQAASAMIDMSELEGVELASAEYSVDAYWANSASQSYCNAVEAGNVRVVKV